MGIVYEAEQQHPRRRVALKVVRGGQFVDERCLRMFRREAETLARLRHPNIARHLRGGPHRRRPALLRDGAGRGRRRSTRSLASASAAPADARSELRERLRALRHDLPTPSTTRTSAASSTATSSPRTSSSRDRVRGRRCPTRSSTSAWRASPTRDVAAATVVTEVGSDQGHAAVHEPRAGARRQPTTSTCGPTSTRSASSSTRCSPAGGRTTPPRRSIVQAVRTICEEPPRPLRRRPADAAIDPDLADDRRRRRSRRSPTGATRAPAALAEDVERYLANQPILAHPPSTMYQLRKLVSRHKGRRRGGGRDRACCSWRWR